MKKLLNVLVGMVIGVVLTMAIVFVGTEKEIKEEIKVADIYAQFDDVQRYGDFYLEKGDILILFDDDSYLIINEQKNNFTYETNRFSCWFNTLEQVSNYFKNTYDLTL